MKQKIISFVLLSVTVIAMGILFGQKNIGQAVETNSFSPAQTTQVRIGNKTYSVELALTAEQQAKGLSNRVSMSLNGGMLFIFDSPSQPSFWMKEMQFPIDIIWIYQDKIVDISPNLPIPVKGTATDQLPTWQPKTVIDHVLELNAGQAVEFKIGDRIEILNSYSV